MSTKPEPPAEMVEKALNHLVNGDLADFAFHVETARKIWRKYRELVESPEFPEQFRSAFVEQWEREPDDDCGLAGEEALEAGYREAMVPQAIKTARCWMQRQRQQFDDAKFLRDIGIAD